MAESLNSPLEITAHAHSLLHSYIILYESLLVVNSQHYYWLGNRVLSLRIATSAISGENYYATQGQRKASSVMVCTQAKESGRV